MNPWFIAMSVSAFGCFISIIQITSYAADKSKPLKNKWRIASVLLGVAFFYFLYKVITTSTGSGG